MKKMLRLIPFIISIFIFFILSTSLFSGTTGKLRGVVTDARTGEPVAGANVILQGTTLGGATDLDGIYIILLVPPGNYSVEASMIGYKAETQDDVHVESDRTITLNFVLEEAILEGETVVVVTERDLVRLDVSASETNISREEMKIIPFAQSVEDIIGMQAGVQGNLNEGRLEIREGHYSETNVLVDGYSTQDKKFAKVSFPVNLQSIEEVKVLRGGYSAEYGEARSGVINIVTKNPSDELTVSFDYRFEPSGLRHDGRNAYDPQRMWQYQLYDGPNADSTSYIVRYEGITPDTLRWEGWAAYADRLLNDANPDNDLTAQEARELWQWRHRPITYGDIAGHNLDLSVGGGIPSLPWDMNILAGFSYQSRPFTYPQALDNYEEMKYILKVVNKLSPSTNLTLSAWHEDIHTVSQDRAGSSWSNEVKLSYGGGDVEWFYPYRKPRVDRKTTLIGLKMLHIMSPTRYIEADVSFFGAKWNTDKFAQSTVSRTFHGRKYYDPQSGHIPVELGVRDNVSGFNMFGGASSSDNSYSERYRAMVSMVDQFHPAHELKAGIDFRFNKLVEDRFHLHDDDPGQKFIWQYDVSPYEISVYVQDKIEFWGMIANLGLRWDYYNVGEDMPDVWRTLDFASNKEIFDSLTVGTMPMRRPEPLSYFSPRVGVSFPISENSKVYFNYGHFVQVPATEALYSTTADFGMPRVQWLGNSFLTFQKNYNFELGIDGNVYDWFQLHIGAFYKDYSDVESGYVFAHSDQTLVLESAVQREHREVRGLDIEIRKATGRFVTGYFNLNITQKSVSDLHVPGISDIPVLTDNPSIGIDGELRGVPRPLLEEITPYGRGIITLSAPENWGPRVWDYPILHKTRASFGLFYTGPQLVEHPDGGFRDQHPDVKFYTIPRFSSNLRISRDIDVTDKLNLQLYLDISNLWVSKYRTAIPNSRDYYDDLYANGKTDRVGSEEVSDPNILRTESDVLYSGRYRTYILGVRISL